LGHLVIWSLIDGSGHRLADWSSIGGLVTDWRTGHRLADWSSIGGLVIDWRIWSSIGGSGHRLADWSPIGGLVIDVDRTINHDQPITQSPNEPINDQITR
jgi:hypothetical protein